VTGAVSEKPSSLETPSLMFFTSAESVGDEGSETRPVFGSRTTSFGIGIRCEPGSNQISPVSIAVKVHITATSRRGRPWLSRNWNSGS
jgi:hypothetical protein